MLSVERAERRRDGTWTRPRVAQLSAHEIAQLPDADDRWALSLIDAAGLKARPPLEIARVSEPLLDILLPRLCPTGRVRLRQAHPNIPSIASADAERPVPEAAVDKNDGPVSREHHVWSSRQLPTVKPETESQAVQDRADDSLRAGVATPDPRHVTTAMFSGNCVSHWLRRLKTPFELGAYHAH
jgi:hypothetical protein